MPRSQHGELSHDRARGDAAGQIAVIERRERADRFHHPNSFLSNAHGVVSEQRPGENEKGDENCEGAFARENTPNDGPRDCIRLFRSLPLRVSAPSTLELNHRGKLFRLDIHVCIVTSLSSFALEQTLARSPRLVARRELHLRVALRRRCSLELLLRLLKVNRRALQFHIRLLQHCIRDLRCSGQSALLRRRRAFLRRRRLRRRAFKHHLRRAHPHLRLIVNILKPSHHRADLRVNAIRLRVVVPRLGVRVRRVRRVLARRRASAKNTEQVVESERRRRRHARRALAIALRRFHARRRRRRRFHRRQPTARGRDDRSRRRFGAHDASGDAARRNASIGVARDAHGSTRTKRARVRSRGMTGLIEVVNTLAYHDATMLECERRGEWRGGWGGV